MQKIKAYLSTPIFHFNRLQFNLLGLVFVSFGFFFAMFIFVSDVILPVFAASTPWTQTNWSGGQSDSLATGTVTTYSAVSSTDPTTTSGQIGLSATEELSNTGFETNVTGWDGGVAPSSISGLRMWYKADAIIGKSDGDSVTTWADSSGNGLDATQNGVIAVPIYKTNIMNGQPVLRFGNSGVLNLLRTASQTLNARTQFVISAKLGNPIGTYHSLFIQTTDPFYQFYSPTGLSTMHYYMGTDVVGDNYTGNQLFEATSGTSGGSVFYMNGVQKATTGIGSSSTTAAFEIGGYTSGNYGTNGDIPEVIVFDSVLSASDRKNVEEYLQAKYGISAGSVTTSRDTGTFYAGSASMKLVAGTNGGNITQTVNVGDTDTYNLEAYVYTNGSAVSSSDAEFYYNGSTVSTTYTSVGSGWYKLSGTVTGANSSRQYGVQVKADKTVYVDNFSVHKYATSGTLTSNIFDSEQLSAWGTLSYTSSGSMVTVKARSSNDAGMSGATAFSSCDAITSGTDISSNNCMTDGHRYVQYLVTLSTADTTTTPTFSDISIGFTSYDSIAPPTNASSIAMATASSGGRSIASNGWNNSIEPYFSWTAGADDGGAGLKGYCLYLGIDADANPATAKGVLGTSPVSLTGSTCQFIISSTSIDLATAGYLGSTLTAGETYYLLIKAIDNANNIFSGSAASFHFRQDATAPTNVAHISAASGSFSNVVDMTFSWPTSGGSASSDSHAGVLGWQYQLNGTGGAWQGTTAHPTLNLDYIPATASSYILMQGRDADDIVSGNNTVYFRSIDAAGNPSSSSTYRTGNLSYGASAPTFDGDATVTITPSSSTTNSFGLSWPAATATGGQSVARYYYMINTSPPSTYATLTSNSSTYISTTSLSVSAAALPNVNKGANTVYVVAVDNASTPNYSPSNVISGTFILNSTDPDNPGNLVVSDSSIKATSQWNVTLTWTAPSYAGAGNLTYLIYRSTDNNTFTEVGTSTGLSYVDNAPSSTQYYYQVYTEDGADAQSSGTNAVSITPTGSYTTAPDLSSGPTVSDITTKKATITWSTSRSSDSKVSYGTSSGSYGSVDASNTSQVSSHSISLTNLSPGTTYYYVAKWTDEDGNTGTSSEKSFTTEASPNITDPKAKSIGISSAVIEYTVKGAKKVKIYYGKTTGFGGVKEISTSTSETTYTTELVGLDDGVKYYYKITTFDSEGAEYEGNTLTFETLPRPKISGVRIQQVSNAAQPTVLVTWTTNTEISSIVTYYPESSPSKARDEVNVALTKGKHEMIIRGLFAQNDYALQVKGRDKAGNEAISDIQRFTTATDTRPPQISELKVEGVNIATSGTNEQQKSQLLVSWNTDEAATSQVEFGEGTGNTYAQKTQEDANLTYNHTVVISGLTPSKVYHLRAVSKDKQGNEGPSIDTVSITPKATDNALDLVINNLSEAFGFLRGIGR